MVGALSVLETLARCIILELVFSFILQINQMPNRIKMDEGGQRFF